ncbi:Cytochrome b5 heme-binding domain-containing protein [Plasmodiophora brassicae]
MSDPAKPITIDEVKNHKGDNWIAIGGSVYDVKAFKNSHPGGKSILEKHSGTDATAAFDKVGHPQEAKIAMAKFKIGVLAKAA